MNSLPLIIAICLGFIFSFLEHISFVMYLSSGIIFYFYLPVLYCYSRVNRFNHVRAKEFLQLKYYPLEFLIWLVTTCFFSFILAHLLADLLDEINKPIRIIAFLLILVCLVLIYYRELTTKKLHSQDVKINYEKQGRIICFEVLFIFVLLFLLSH